ncbi:hypothetical protein ALC57_07769, partial [Trachymyrmex cornetzi]
VCFAFLLRSWILRTFWVGYRRDLEVTDLYTPLKEHTSDILGVKIAKAWEKEWKAYQCRLEQVAKCGSQKKIKEPNLMRVLIRCFGFKILLCGTFMAVIETLLRYNFPFIFYLEIVPCKVFRFNILHFLHWRCLDNKKLHEFNKKLKFH